MGSRMPGFDYSRPYFYMVTLKRRAGYPAFGRIVGDKKIHYLECNAITYLFLDIIKTFHETWYCIAPIECFAIMPDHIHLLIRIKDIEKRESLPVIVRLLIRALEKSYFAKMGGGGGMGLGGASPGITLTDSGETGAGKRGAVARSAGQHLFESDWHDWIIANAKQLMAFTRYIRENAARAWFRQSHPEYFRRIAEIEFWDANGMAMAMRRF